MKIKPLMKKILKTIASILRILVHVLARRFGIPRRISAGHFDIDPVLSLPATPSSPNDQHSGAAADLDQRTSSGLTLREALPVRTAEYWLRLGMPALALEELQTLSATARRHPWPRQVAKTAALASATA
jgi:hypothetical protein